MRLVFPARCARREHRVDTIEKAGPRVGKKAAERAGKEKEEVEKSVFINPI
jgi:hypothetical protein